MLPVLGFLFVASVAGQCSKSDPLFRIDGANDELVVCVLPPNTKIDVSLNAVVPDTAICALACDSGYDRETVNSRTLSCAGTSWVSAANVTDVCQSLVCPDLKAPSNSPSATCANATEGDSCEMVCDSGFMANLDAPRVCLGGVWNGGSFACTPMVCPTLVPPTDSGGTACVDQRENDVCTFSCPGGATSAGNNVRTCSNGMWTGTPFTCTPANYCPQLYSPHGAYPAVCTHATAGSQCTFTAMPGYTIANGTRTCVMNSTNLIWNGADAVVTALTCPPLLAPANAENSTSCDVSLQGAMCVHQCLDGFVSNNQGIWTCHNRQWLGAALSCAPQSCPLLTSPDNAFTASCDSATEGSLCTFFCKPGFKSVGHGARVCHAGAWSGYSFQCVAALSRYAWVAGSFGPCLQNNTVNQTCGNQGVMKRNVGCVDTATVPYNTVSSTLCNTTSDAHEVSSTLSCPLEPCPTFDWQFGAWSTCSADCGGGYQLRTASCVSSLGAIMDDSKCPELAVIGRRSCNTQACTGPHWSASEWTPCSGGCYDGQGINNTRTRASFCLDELGNAAPIAQCTNPRPPMNEVCNTQPCTGYLWEACPWEVCTAQCNGGGTKAGLMAGQRQRNVFCKDGKGMTVASSLCAYVGLPTPVTLMVGCNPDACTGYNWMTTPWSPCTPTGTRTRSYHCHGADGTNALSNMCPNPPPATEEACTPNSCPTMAPTNPGTSRPTPAEAIANGAAQIAVSVLAILPIMLVC